MLGSRIGGRYVVERFVAAGGMGDVYRAHDEHGASVALKVVREGLTSSAKERWLREVSALRALRHPSIVRYLDHGLTPDGAPFVAMDWVEGPTLHDVLEEGPLSEEETITLGLRLAEALAATHSRGVVHGDVKPSNVIVVGGVLERATLIDFGVAVRAEFGRVRGEGASTGGTPAYMPPEQAESSADLDARADVFALGKLLQECVAGRASGGATVVEDEPDPFAPAAPRARADATMSDDLRRVLAVMTEADRDRRPAHAGQVASMLAALGAAPSRAAPSSAARGRLPTRERRLEPLVGVTLSGDGDVATAERVALDHGALRVAKSGPSIVATLDEAEGAARCALALFAALGPRARSIGLGLGRVPLAGACAGVALDEVSARLLARRFVVDGLVLRGARREEPPRPTPFLGRETELARLVASSRRRPGAALVIGGAGTGKSRLVAEAAPRLSGRLLHARADPIRPGSAFALASDLLRSAFAFSPEDSLEDKRLALRRRVEPGRTAADALRVAEFIGEIAFVPFDDDGRPELHSARRDPVLMGDQLKRAMLDWMSTELEVGPVTLALEDVHAADRPTLEIVGLMLERLSDRELFVIATARPEVSTLFPRLFGAEVVEIAELGTAAARALVRHALGESTPGARVDRVVEQAAGNPLFLEELVREVAAHPDAPLPTTVTVMAQARVASLEVGARRVLRAASLFGESFTPAAVAALVGEERAAEAPAWIEDLVERGILEPRGARAESFRFRHSIVREAAYGMLTDDDRRLGHRLAAAFLVEGGEASPFELANHHRLGDQPVLAARAFARAAEQSIAGSDYEAALARVALGVGCGADGPDLGELSLRAAQAYEWRGDNTAMERAAFEALELLPRGSTLWCDALAGAFIASQRAGRVAQLSRLADWLADALALSSSEPLLVAAARAVDNLYLAGLPSTAGPLLARIEALVRSVPRAGPGLEGSLLLATAWGSFHDGWIGCAADFYEPAALAFERAGDVRRACLARANAGSEYALVGCLEEADRVLSRAVEDAGSFGLSHVAAAAQHNLGLVRARLGDVDGGRSLEEQAIAAALAQGNLRLAVQSRIYLARIHDLGGDREGAAREASAAARSTPIAVGMRAYALGVASRALLSLGLVGDALAAARLAKDDMTQAGTLEEGETLVKLAWAEALIASGAPEAERRAAIEEARSSVLEQAGRLRNSSWRDGFLHRMEENARALELG